MANLDRITLEDKGLLSSKTQSIFDPAFTKAFRKVPWEQWYSVDKPMDCRLEFLKKIDHWIHSTELNKISGLDRFKRRDLINGTTQGFDEFYFRNRNRRLRIFRGEYAYHQRINQISYIEDEPLQQNDYLIISLPFCSLGASHPQMIETLDQAKQLGLPVLIDAAYFGTCYELQLDFSHPAIECVCFSLTKGLGLGDIRSGIRYSNYDDNLPICQQNNYNHTVLGAAKIGLYMMEQFSPDFLPSKYLVIQKSLSEQLGLIATNCVHIANGGADWDAYKIDSKINRIGLSRLIKAIRKNEISL